MKVATGLMGILFLFAVAVQYNDPDPLRWMAIYGLAALACGLSLANRLRRVMPALIGVGALAWAGTLAPGAVGRASLGELFQSYAMVSETVEEAREMGGLLIVVAWMGLLALVGSRPV
jgi:hypothetical protein